MADQKLIDLSAVVAPVDADLIYTVTDVATTPTSKKATWTVIKAFLKTYFDTIYLASFTFSDNEIPTGDINAVNTDFVLANTPSPAASLKVYLNGQRMKLTDDYTLSTATISFIIAPNTGSLILCDYRY